MEPKSVAIGLIFGLINTRLLKSTAAGLLQVGQAGGVNEEMRVSRPTIWMLVGFKFLILGLLFYLVTQTESIGVLWLAVGLGLGTVIGLALIRRADRRAGMQSNTD